MRIEDVEPGKCYKINESRGFKFIIPLKKAVKKDEDKFCIPALVFSVYDDIDNMDIYSLYKPDHMLWLYRSNEDGLTKATSKTFRYMIDKFFSVENRNIML